MERVLSARATPPGRKFFLLMSRSSTGQNSDFALFELIKRTNLDVKDSACLLVVNILQQTTSRPTTSSKHNTMVNTPKKNFSPLPVGKYSKSTQKATLQHHRVNQGKSSFEAEHIHALGALRSL